MNEFESESLKMMSGQAAGCGSEIDNSRKTIE